MADFYYRYNNKGVDGSKTVLLNDAYLGSAVPFASNLHRRFRAEDFNAATKVWKDSALAQNITATGTITKVINTGNKQFRSMSAVQFDTTAGILFNNDVLPAYTMFTITRYTGTNNKRIVNAVTEQFLSGHWNNIAGVIQHYLSYIPQGPNAPYYSPLDASNIHTTNFFIGTDISNEYFTNGISRGTVTPSSSALPKLGINQGTQYGSERSDGQLLDILMYNRVLTVLERKKVEHYLASYYGILDTSGNLTASYNRTLLTSETSLLVSTAASPNWIAYPSFSINQTGLAFAMWFRTDISSTVQFSRLFDFGNEVGTDNIIAFIYNGNLGIDAYSGSINIQLRNVISGCNDNVWRHFIWTISADGLTWKVYINRVLRATITADTVSNYESGGTLQTPLYPSSVLRTSNFIGKSNWSTHPPFIGAIDEFRMYNKEIGPQSIHYPWFLNVTTPEPIVYNRPKLATEYPLLVSTAASPNWIVYPSFYIEQKGISFSLWFKSNGTGSWGRFIDFSNGPSANNIIIAMLGTNLAVSVYGASRLCDLTNVFPNCNDNVWRHLVWTISPDGLTWKIYINRVLYANITASNFTSYGNAGDIPPCHPPTGQRVYNFIGKSAWDHDSLLIGEVDDFQMYNYTLDQNAINSPSLVQRYLRERLPSETSLITSTPTNRNYLSYPSFFTAQTGMTFAFWLKAGTNADFSRIFDFSNGLGRGNIIAEIHGGNLGLAMFNSNGDVSGGGNFQVLNAFSGIADSQWRHITWTISADGLTYLIYINKVLRSTITAATQNNFSKVNVLSPFHPIVGLRSLNYLFQSAYPGDTNSLNATIHAFQLYNTPLDQTAINALYTETALDIQKVYGAEPFFLSNPVSTGSGAFTFTSSNTAVATIENNLVTIVGSGTTIITALQWTETITATLTVAQPNYVTPDLTLPTNTNYLVTMKGKAYDVNQAILRNIQQTVNLKKSLQTIGFGSTANVYKKNITCTMNGISQIGDTLVSFGKPKKPMWVMGGNTTHTLAYSYDGINWNGLGTSILTSVIGIAWNGTLWVAVGTKTSVPNIAYSYDGFTWTSKPLPIFTSNIHDVAWNGKMFVVVGSGTNGIGYSYNGIDWYAATSISTTFTYGRDIGWNGRMWVAVGSAANKIVYSYDGIRWFPNTTTVLDAGYGITYDGKKWIAVGTGTTNFIADSVDGITWTGRGKANFVTECHGVASNGIVTVVIGRGGGNLAYSYGNNVWTTVSMPTLTYAQRIKWNGTMFVAMSWSTVSIFYSYNGIQWNSVDSSDMTFGTCVAHNNALEDQIVFKQRTYVAGGQGTNTLAYSFDGITWKGLGTGIFDSYCRGLTFGNLWVAVGTFNNTIAYSYDGINWTGLGRSAIDSWGACAAYNGSLWLVGGSGTKKIATSTTGTSFTGIDSPFSDTCHGIAWNGNVWVAIGYFTTTMAWSTNGTTWTAVVNPPITYAGMSVVWNGFMFVACGDGTNSLCWSIDGKTWIAGTTSTGESTSLLSSRFYSAAYNGTMWLAGGAGEKKLAYSYDGKLWIPIYNLPFSTGILRVLWDKQKWIAGGWGTNSMGYSYDGFTWVSLDASISTNTNWMDYDAVEPDTYIYMARPTVALGGNGTDTKSIVFSSDGFTWTQTITPTLSQGLCAAYNGSLWIAGGIGTYTMVYSTNGINWSPVLSSKSIFSTEVRGIAYNGTLWIAGGYGTNNLAYSYDGLSWTPVPNAVHRVYNVVWNGVLFIAACSGTKNYIWSGRYYKDVEQLLYSYDGITWRYTDYLIGEVNDVAYSGTMWIAAGSSIMAYSYDGIRWTGLGKIIFNKSNAIAHNGFVWVAGGEGSNTLAYSYDGFSWTGLGTSIFTSCSAVTWNGNKWIATGSGTHSIAYSVDGKTWIGLGTLDLTIGFGVASHTDTKVVDASITSDSLSFSVDVAQSGYRNLAIGVKGTLY